MHAYHKSSFRYSSTVIIADQLNATSIETGEKNSQLKQKNEIL